MIACLRRLFAPRPTVRFGQPTGHPDIDAYSEWWGSNAPAWNRDDYRSYMIGLTAWLDSRHYWRSR